MLSTRKKQMLLALVMLPLTLDFMRPSKLHTIDGILDEKTEEGMLDACQVTVSANSFVVPLAFKEWKNVSKHHTNLNVYFKEEVKQGIKDWQVFTSTKNISNFDLLIFNPYLDSSVLRHPSFKTSLRMLTRALNILFKLGCQTPSENDFGKFHLAITFLERLQAQHFFRGRGTSKLSGLIFTDLRRIYRMLVSVKRLNSLLKESLGDSCWNERLDKRRERAPFNPTGQASNDITYDIKECMKENPRQVTVVDCLRSRQEFWDVYQIISNFFAFKLSQECRHTYPASYLQSITAEVRGYPGILFERSRFINYEEDFNKSDRGFIDFMDKKEISRSPLILSVFSSLSYSIVSDAHISSHFPYRRSACGTHLGLMKCILKYNSWVSILGTKRILKQVRSSCLPCRKQLQSTLSRLPGKIHPHRVNANRKQGSLQIDLIPSLTVRPHPGARKTRNSASFQVHVLIGCDIFSRYCSFCLIPDRSASSLVTGLNVISAKVGHPVTNILCDRESGVVAIVNRDPSWEIYKNGIYNQQMTISFSPALAEAHSRHGLAESRVRAVKQSIGNSDLSDFDPVSLNLHLEVLFHNLNSIPLITKSVNNGDIDCLQLRSISPNTLFGREVAPFLLSIDPVEQSLQSRAHTKMIIDQTWKIWSLMARPQKEKDVKAHQIPLGSVIIFRRDESRPGNIKNRFSVGLVIRMGEKNLDGVIRSLFILAVCKREKGDVGEGPLVKKIYHRRVEDVIVAQTESSLELELAIEREARSHEGPEETATDLLPDLVEPDEGEQEEDSEETEKETSLMVSHRVKAASPSFSLLLLADQLGLCQSQASEIKEGEEDMENCFNEAVFSITLILVVLILAGGVSRKPCLLGAILFLPRVVRAMPWESLVPVQPEDVASYVIKGMLKKIKEKLRQEALSQMNQIKRTFSTSTTLRSTWSLIIFLLLVLLTPVHSSWHGHGAWPKYGLWKTPVKISPHQAEETVKDALLSDQDSLVEILGEAVNDTAVGSMTNNNTLQSLLQCLELPDGPFSKADNGNRECLNASSNSQGVELYKLSQDQSHNDSHENLGIKLNLSLTLCHDYVLLNFSKETKDSPTINWLFRFEKEMKKDYKILIILVLGLYSAFLSYTSICTIFFSICKRMRKWLGKRKDKAENTNDVENIYQPMNEIKHHDAGLLILPEYDQLPLHGAWPVVRYDALPEPILPVDPLQWDGWDKMDQQQQLDPAQKTRSAEIFPSGSTMSRRSSLLSISLLSLLFVAGSKADQEVGSGFQLYAGDGFEGKETLSVKYGTDVSLLCRSHSLYGGEVSWGIDNPGILSTTIRSGNHLIIPKLTSNVTATCTVTKGFSIFKDIFTVLVEDPNQEEALQIPRTIQAFDCESPLSHPLAEISSFTEECKISDFSSYRKMPRGNYTLLGRDRVKQVRATRCHIKIEVSTARCDGYTLGGFTKSYSGLYDTSLQQCEELSRTGTTNLSIHTGGFYRSGTTNIVPCIMQGGACYEEHQGGLKLANAEGIRILFNLWGFSAPSPFKDGTIGPVQMGDFWSKMIYLGDSGVDNANPNKPCWGVKRSYYMGVKASPAKLDHSLGKPKQDLVANMFVSAYLDETTAFVDYQSKIITFPKYGRKIGFQETGDIIHFTDAEDGLIFLKVPEEVSEGFYVIENNISGVLFTDQTNKEHPDVLTLDFHEKSLALQLYESFSFENKAECFKTQLEDIFSCKYFSTEGMELKPEVLLEISSQRFLFQQLATSNSIQGILYHLCSTRKMLLDIGINQISKTQGILFGLRKGIFTMQLGETFVLFQCDETEVSIQRLPRDHCVNELPVIVHTSEGPRERFLSPNTRILIDEPSPTFCSRKFPVKFRVTSKLSLCQYGDGGGVSPCESTEALDPKDGLSKHILRTLNKQQSVGPRYETRSQLSKLLINLIAASNFHRSLGRTVSYNALVCEGSLLCENAFFLTPRARQELGRQSLNYLEKLFNNTFYQVLSLISNIWVLYSIGMGLTCFIIRFSAVIKRRKYGGFFVLLLNFLIELEQALNPLSLSKAKIKQRQRSTLLELDDIKNRLYLLENRFHTLSNIHNDDNDDDGDDDTNSLTNSLINQPVEAPNIFRQKSSFQHRHEEIGKMVKRKFVTFKDHGKDHQSEDINDSDGFPPPPSGLDEPPVCEDTGLLSVKEEDGGPKGTELPPSTTRPRLKISRVRSPGFSGQPPPTPPPPLSPTPTPPPARPRGKRSPAPPPPPAGNNEKK